MSKNVVDGKLVETSPSMITAFDPSTAFGCERRGFYRYVLGLPDPPSGNQQLGTDLHALVQERLVTGKTPVAESEAAGLYLAGQAMIEQVAARKILSVEAPLATFKIADVKLKGYIDVVTSDGIIDWKTSSDIRRYGKTAEQLATDTQMVLYGKATHDTLATVKLAHGQFQTKGRKYTDFVEVEVTQDHLDRHIDKVIVPLVERIKVVAGFTDAREAVPDFKKCFNCAFSPKKGGNCPQPGAESVMSFFQNLNKKTTNTTVGQVVESTTASIMIKPPDAPPSDPAQAADPVEGFSAVPPARRSMKMIDEPAPEPGPTAPGPAPAAFKGESQTDREARQALEYSQKLKEEAERAKENNKPEVVEEPKRGRGRPPGAKNKAKAEPLSDIPAQRMQQVIEKLEDGEIDEKQAKKLLEVAPAERKFKSQTFTFGATINVGNFSGVRFDWSITSEEHTREELQAEVMRRIDEMAAKYEAEIDQKNKVFKNAREVVGSK